MKYYLSFLLLFSIKNILSAQTPLTREQMKQPDRASKEQLSAGYQTSINGWVIHEQDTLELGKGSRPDKKFAFIYESPLSFGASLDPNKRRYLESFKSGQAARVKELLQYGTKRSGYTMVAKIGTGDIINYWVEIDNAVESGELVAPARFRVTKPPVASGGGGSVADELKKLKELLDAGAITKDEFDAQKKKLLGN